MDPCPGSGLVKSCSWAVFGLGRWEVTVITREKRGHEGCAPAGMLGSFPRDDSCSFSLQAAQPAGSFFSLGAFPTSRFSQIKIH